MVAGVLSNVILKEEKEEGEEKEENVDRDKWSLFQLMRASEEKKKTATRTTTTKVVDDEKCINKNTRNRANEWTTNRVNTVVEQSEKEQGRKRRGKRRKEERETKRGTKQRIECMTFRRKKNEKSKLIVIL